MAIIFIGFIDYRHSLIAELTLRHHLLIWSHLPRFFWCHPTLAFFILPPCHYVIAWCPFMPFIAVIIFIFTLGFSPIFLQPFWITLPFITTFRWFPRSSCLLIDHFSPTAFPSAVSESFDTPFMPIIGSIIFAISSFSPMPCHIRSSLFTTCFDAHFFSLMPIIWISWFWPGSRLFPAFVHCSLPWLVAITDCFISVQFFFTTSLITSFSFIIIEGSDSLACLSITLFFDAHWLGFGFVSPSRLVLPLIFIAGHHLVDGSN